MPKLSADSKYRILLVLLFLGALALRLWHIGFGLPLPLHPDELTKYPVVVDLSHLRSPGYFKHPGLLVNSLALAVMILRPLGLPETFPAVTFVGRVLVALVGALTLFPTGALARELFGRRAGVFAAAAMAVAPLHVVHSRFFKEDIYLTFAVVLGTWAAVRWAREWETRGNPRPWLFLACISCGLATASKFVGVIALLPLLWFAGTRPGMTSWAQRRRLAILAAVTTAAVFLVLSPQVLTDLQAVKQDAGYELTHGTGVSTAITLPIWNRADWGRYFFLHGVGWGLGWSTTILGAIILLSLLGRRLPAAARFTAWSGVFWYFAMELTPIKRTVAIERYIIPVLPFLAVAASAYLNDALGGIWLPPVLRPAAIRVPVALLVLAMPLVHSIQLTAILATDTTTEAHEWLQKHIYAWGGRVAQARMGEFKPGQVIGEGDIFPIEGYDEERALDLATYDAVIISGHLFDRYQRFPSLSGSKKVLKTLGEIRDDFPESIVFSVPDYLRAGFHNPTLEIRLRGLPRLYSQPGS